MLDGVSYGRRRQRCDPGAGGGPPRRPDHRGDPYRPFADVYTRSGSSGWSAGWESSLQPLVNLVHHHETTYRAIQQFIEKPPGKLRIFEIYPQRPLRSMALGSRLPALLEDYKTGRQCGRYFRQRWVNYWPTSRRCCVTRRVLPGPRRWWCRRCRWPMKRPRRPSFLRPGE